MSFELDNEKATDVLIWWVESSDGSIDFREEEAVKEALNEMQFSLETYYEEARMHISGLPTDKVKQLIEQSIQWAGEHFDESRKKKTIRLVKIIAEADGQIEDKQQEKLDHIKKGFNLM